MSEKLKKDLGLYIHIPFCVRKCDYCDFLSAPADEKIKERYVKALLSEIKNYSHISEEYLVKTIFIGGGTPSSLKGEFIADIMKTVREVFMVPDRAEKQPEITIEVNPGTLSLEKLEIYKGAGINRLSFGLQSADNRELKLLGRIHTYETFEKNYLLARKAGFSNINVDLMSALPGQSIESWLRTLDKVLGLAPEHISAYSLILEEGTPFYQRYKQEDQDEELDRLIYARTKKVLQKAGYKRYEISNYSKPGYESRHNISYWIRTDYLGLGLGASSMLKNTRFKNIDKLDEYIKLSSDRHKIRTGIESLNQARQMEEFMFLGLRMSEGIDKNNFEHLFGTSLESIYKEIINKSIQEGLIREKGDKLLLTDKGIDLSNMVMSRFLID